jgi:transcriptional regulator with GAF, ATPase, and Fis domain
MDHEQDTGELPAGSPGGALSLDIQDDAGGRSLDLEPAARLLVGSAAHADVRLEDRTVSGEHVELTVHENGALLRDVGSKNGSWVGGARVREAWAAAGTTVNVGRSTLTLRARAAEEPEGGAPLPGVVGTSWEMRVVAARVRRLAQRNAPVLLVGETGTGKELVARAIHDLGARRGPMLTVNVAAIPRELVESELFGHERGAFTGAVARRDGYFLAAAGGTLFLDEIGELPLDVQPKLLRALDGYDVSRVGQTGRGQRLTARVVAATNVALERRVGSGDFRADLFHRLAVYVVELPPLRARRGDVCAMAQAMVADGDAGGFELTTAALSRLTAYDWPGNARELRAVILRAAELAGGRRVIDASEVERALIAAPGKLPRGARLSVALAKATLSGHGGNVSAAARALGVPRTTFRKLLAR